MSDPAAPPTSASVPTLYEWMGGQPAVERLFGLFYARVPADPLLAPVFERMPPTHAHHVALFVAEVLGGPPDYSRELGGERGGHARMVTHHIGRALTEPQRARWVALLLACVDEAGLPADPEFRSALVAYLEWGSRLAVLNSHASVPPHDSAAMPRWGWGVPGGPYLPEGGG